MFLRSPYDASNIQKKYVGRQSFEITSNDLNSDTGRHREQAHANYTTMRLDILLLGYYIGIPKRVVD